MHSDHVRLSLDITVILQYSSINFFVPGLTWFRGFSWEDRTRRTPGTTWTAWSRGTAWDPRPCSESSTSTHTVSDYLTKQTHPNCVASSSHKSMSFSLINLSASSSGRTGFKWSPWTNWTTRPYGTRFDSFLTPLSTHHCI